MSQLNLKKIISSNNISTLVDIINYNFDQIILNGGGPDGLRGLIGAPGLPGLQGIEGETGPTGIDGTYIFTAPVEPTDYVGASGENVPRLQDIFIQVNNDSLVIWQNETGPSGTQWVIHGTVSAPGGNSKLLYKSDWVSGPSGPRKVAVSNDPTVAGNGFFGDIDAFSLSNGVLSSTSTFSSNYSTQLVYRPNVLTVAGNKYQLRLLCSDIAMNLGSGNNFSTIGGGVVHSIEVDTNGKQWYRITNGDTIGNKQLSISLNTGYGKLLIGSTANNLCVGGNEGEILQARLTINSTLAVGNSVGYAMPLYYYKNLGIISQGNISVGRVHNYYYQGAFYGTGGASSRLMIDADSPNPSSTYPTSELILSSNKGKITGQPVPRHQWTLWHDARNNVSNTMSYGSLNLRHTYDDGAAHVIDHLYFHSDSYSSVWRSRIGVANINPTSGFEVGYEAAGRISIGQCVNSTSPTLVDYMSHYLSFNMHRSPVRDKWIRRSNGSQNNAGVIWNGPYTNFNFSLFNNGWGACGNSGTQDVVTHTDKDVYDATKLTISATPGLYFSESNSVKHLDKNLVIFELGATGDLSFNYWNIGRRPVAIFGAGLSGTYRPGSPMIYDTNGVTQSPIIKPQYSFYGTDSSDHTGLFLAQGHTAANSYWDTGIRTSGIAVNGIPAIFATQSRVGIHTRTPHERLQIGDRTIFHDGGSKFWGHNLYYGVTGSVPIQGLYTIINDTVTSAGLTMHGAALYHMGEEPIGPYSGVNFFSPDIFEHSGALRAGGQHSFEVFNPVLNGTSVLSNTSDDTASKVFLTTSGYVYPLFSNTFTNAPKFFIGFDTEKVYDYSSTSAKLQRRGTLPIVAQNIRKKLGFYLVYPHKIDDYNIGLYDYAARPVAGIAVNNDAYIPSPIPNPSTDIGFDYNTGRQFQIRLLSTSGGSNIDADADITALSIKSSMPSGQDIIPISDKKRQFQIGSGFRVGIGKELTTTDNASLEVGVTGGATIAANFDGHVSLSPGSDILNTGSINPGWEVLPINDNTILCYTPSGCGIWNVTGAKIGKYKIIGKTAFISIYISNATVTQSGAIYFGIKLPDILAPHIDAAETHYNIYASTGAAWGKSMFNQSNTTDIGWKCNLTDTQSWPNSWYMSNGGAVGTSNMIIIGKSGLNTYIANQPHYLQFSITYELA